MNSAARSPITASRAASTYLLAALGVACVATRLGGCIQRVPGLRAVQRGGTRIERLIEGSALARGAQQNDKVGGGAIEEPRKGASGGNAARSEMKRQQQPRRPPRKTRVLPGPSERVLNIRQVDQREKLRTLRRECLARGVTFSIVDGIDALEVKLKTEEESRPSFGFTSASWSAFA